MLEDGGRPQLMYRERPFSDLDSGWRFFCGDEEGAFAADPRNILMVPLGDLVERFADVTAQLDAETGAAFERGPDGGWCRNA